MSLSKILASIVGIAVVGAGGYYVATQGLPNISGIKSDSEAQALLDAAIIKQFGVESAATASSFAIEFDVPSKDVQGDISFTLTGGANNLTAAMPDMEYNLQLTANIAAEGMTIQIESVLDAKIIDQVIYYRIGDTSLAGLPEEVSGIADFYISLMRDKWFEMPLAELLALDPAAAAEFEIALADNAANRQVILDLLSEHQILIATEKTAAKDGKIQIQAVLSSAEIATFAQAWTNTVVGQTGLADLPTAEEWEELKPVLAVLVEGIPALTFTVGEVDGYIHRTVFEAEFDLAKLATEIAAVTGEEVPDDAIPADATFSIAIDSRTTDIGEPYELTTPTDTVNISDLLGGLGALSGELDTPTVDAGTPPAVELTETPAE